MPADSESTRSYEALGTLGFMRRLQEHWSRRSHPVYRLEALSVARILNVRVAATWISRHRHRLYIAAFILMAVVIAQVTLQAQWQAFISVVCGFGLFLPLVVTFGIIYCMPVIVALITSGVVVVERERQTWDMLLSTALDWGDLLLAKLARLLRNLNPYEQIIPIIYVMLMALTGVFAIVHYSNHRSGVFGEVLEWVLIFLAPVQYIIERVQDFVFAALIGLIASLIAPSRQIAAALALFGALAFLMLRALIIVLLITAMEPPTPSGVLILMLTGPATGIVMALPVGLALLALISLPIMYETVIRAMYRWLVRHLGEARLTV